ncbi:LysR family transcriptional regulator [Clostridioides difficile]
MNIEGFKYFYNVAKIKSISKVANSSHISQSALSQQLSKLEEKLGVTVFKRSNKGVELTHEGKIVLKYSEKILNLYDDLLLEISKSKMDKNNLIIETTCLSASYIFPKLLPKLSSRFNNLSYDITNNSKSDICINLINNLCDISIGSIQVSDPDLSSIYLGDDNFIWVSRSSYIFDINTVPFLLLKDETDIESYIQDIINPENIILKTSNIHMITNYLLTTSSIAVLPKLCIIDELSQGILKEVKLSTFSNKSYSLFLSYKNDTLPLIKENVYFIKENMQNILQNY